MEVSGQIHAPAALTHEKEPQYVLDRRLGGPQSRSGRCGEKILTPAGNRTWAVQPVALPTEINHSLTHSLMELSSS
jgi:hypothetical protein